MRVLTVEGGIGALATALGPNAARIECVVAEPAVELRQEPVTRALRNAEGR
ncbi:hypothetical protein Sros_1815 [Streptosporangium roseum DSM 43021]|uniref:Uncharacterized protein n=1 Tax=Streptosporangium roseum (strain ATCC 12428 / DSM 43021 / JCM 3005 / KCTC 9067 / NCIMB 10171 / NRRL 2505 / NI 9100) TaxID=479432 RepID=D2ATC8_STRRD|nr:hypothetical protein Sros_1815 [Streptosporangium roseum DSM 43021]